MSEDLKLSVVIVTYNSAKDITRTLDSLEKQLSAVPFEVCVVDNASSDETMRAVEEHPLKVRMIANKQNLGFAKAVNQGLWETSAPFVMWLNPDAELLDGSFKELLEEFDQRSDLGIVGPKIVNEDGSRQLSFRSFPSYENFFFNRYSLLTKWFPKNRFSKKYLHSDTDDSKAKEVDWVSGACLIHRRELLHRVGLLDERFFMYFEEVDFCRRAKKEEFKVMYIPSATVKHAIAGSSRQVSIRTLVIRHQSIWAYYQKYFEPHKAKDTFVAIGLLTRCMVMIVLAKLKFKTHRG